MSDPVSNHDIEDVLSSIRRLVAQGDPRRMDPPSSPKPSVVTPEAPEPANKDVTANTASTEKLVLTPAFRVLTNDESDFDAQSSAPANADADLAKDTPEEESVVAGSAHGADETVVRPVTERASLEAKIAALEAAVSGVNDDFEPDGSEQPSRPTLDSPFLNGRDKQPAEESAEYEATPEGTLNDAVVAHISETVADEIAGAFPHLNAVEASPEADQTVVPLNRDGRSGRALEEKASSPEQIAEEEVVVVAPKIHKPAAFRMDAAPVTESDPEPEMAEAHEPTIEVVDPVTTEAPTFRRSASDVYDPVAEATADAAEAAADAGDIYGDELAPDLEGPGTSVAEKAPAGALMDPDMVRDMVSQMIREELQGEMGERITRNVRKLVRREINRVLSAQEFD